MDSRTGEIGYYTDAQLKAMAKDDFEAMVMIQEGDMTAIQKRGMKVSLHDHRSKLGEQLTKERGERGMTKNSMRRLRRQGKIG